MKKYLILTIVTVIAIGAIVGVRLGTKPKETTVSLTTVTATTVRKTVKCSGKVQATDSEEVFVATPCIAGDVYVKKGQRVKRGEALFAVDTEATAQVLSQLGSAVSDVVPVTDTVTAPVSGVITSLNVREGDVADKQTPCAVITVDEGVCITVAVREKYISGIEVGQAAEVTGVAFDKKVYHGTITQIAEKAHQTYVGTVSETVVDAVIRLNEEETDDSLRAGLNARATVETDVVKDALIVPYDCIAQNDEGGEYVYVYNGDGTARKCVPTFGEEYADGILVVSGLSSGAQLVRDPERLSDDVAAVRVG